MTQKAEVPDWLKEFQSTDEYAELENHRIKLLEFYSSQACAAQQAFIDVMLARAHEGAFAGKTVEVREEARAQYLALQRMKKLPAVIMLTLQDDAPAEGQEKKA